MKISLIYKNIYIYRFVMHCIYLGQYRNRFNKVINHIKDTDQSIFELCFGDIYIAEFCRKKQIKWQGYDISHEFVANARKKKFDAYQENLLSLNQFPDCDTVIMIGSLYHFVNDIEPLFEKIKRASKRFIISEPIRNWTNGPGVLSFLAKKFTKAGNGEEEYRFTSATLIKQIEKFRYILQYNYTIEHAGRDIIVEITWLK